MLNKLKSIVFGDKKKNVYMPIDEQSIKENEKIKALSKTVMSQQAQLSTYQARDKLKQDKLKEVDKDSERNKKLKEQALDLKEHRYGKVESLNDFYKIYFRNQKFREKLEICDRDDSMVLDKFKDFVLMEGGKFGIRGQSGEVLAYGSKINSVIYKPDSFRNQVRRGRFLIPMDKDGNWMEDLEYIETEEPLESEFDEETGKIKWIRWSKLKRTEAKKVIARLMEEKNAIAQEYEREEGVVIKLKNQIDDLKRSIKIVDNEKNVSQTELSKVIFRVNETEKRFSDIHSQNTRLIEMKATYESVMDAQRGQIDIILAKLDKYTDPKSQMIKDDIYDDLERAKSLLPERVEIKQEAPPEPKQITQPGDIIKR